ncbi:hypothetical protein AOX55_00005545 (plasmid) [Sinorhizobium fredii CCBAU 25509]|nr:hypothetical protein AOX55_00005545 [Sinorhizobium fredii CCBAU 25509]
MGSERRRRGTIRRPIVSFWARCGAIPGGLPRIAHIRQSI